MVDPFLPDAAKVAALREALPVTGAGIYLDTATAGPLPSEIIQAARDAEDWDVRTGRSGEGQREETLQRLDETRAVLAALIGGDPRDIALTHGSPEAVAAAGWSIDWRRGDRLVAASDLAADAMAPLVALAARQGLELAVVEAAADDDDDALLGRLRQAIRPAARLVAVPHIAARSGRAWPVDRVAGLAHDAGAWLLVDGSHAVGAIPVDAPALGADLYALDGHRWLLGPEGTGALWVGERARRDALVASAGPLGYETLLADGSARPWPDARRFETGPFHRPSMVALGRAVGWLEMYLGLPWIHEQIAAAAADAHQRLAAIPGVTVLTPGDRRAAIVSFTIAGWAPSQALDDLSRRVFAIASTVSEPDAIRVSLGAFNTGEEIARFTDAVAELARHTPETLPRRPSLVVFPSAAIDPATGPGG
jgi:selenocysteine lyase/cysteine desulfurase